MSAFTLARTRPAPPVRMVHLGLGAFHRAHQAWYTAHSADADQWGIAAFTGRSAAAATVLAHQDCLYSLVTRGPERDHVEVIENIVEAHPAANVARLAELLARPEVGVVTLTVTEAGYTAVPGHDSAMRRLLYGLEARRAASAGPIAIVPCDNLPRNGEVARAAVQALAQVADASLAQWVESHVSFVSTSVDRITPRWDGTPIAALTEAGLIDAAPVIAEPFSDWVLAGEFPAGRPAWETAGAAFVSDVDAFEKRKLWLLNGAHSILAAAGRRRGLVTVADAAADSACMALVEAYWEEAVSVLPPAIETSDYRVQLVSRWRNVRMGHNLDQIAMEQVTKLAVRIGAVATLRRAANLDATGCAAALAEWIEGADVVEPSEDARIADLGHAMRAPDRAQAMVAIVDAGLAGDREFMGSVRARLS